MSVLNNNLYWKQKCPHNQIDQIYPIIYLSFNENIQQIKKIILDISKKYLTLNQQQLLFYFLKSSPRTFFELFQSLKQFTCQENMQWRLNQYTQRGTKDPMRKIIPVLFEFGLCRFLNKFMPNSSFLTNGIGSDISFNGMLIDAKTKTGTNLNFNKDWQITIASNSKNNQNRSKYYCFAFFSRGNQIKKNNSTISFRIAGFIEKQNFFRNARNRQPGEFISSRNGIPILDDNHKKIIARTEQFVTYADDLIPINQFINQINF